MNHTTINSNTMKKLKDWMIIAGLLFLIPLGVSAQQADIDTLTNRLIREQLERRISTATVGNYLKDMHADGSWSDVDYKTTTARLDALKHLLRLVDISIAYSKPGTEYYKSKEVKEKIVAGLNYFAEQKPVSTNWWFNEMGGPQEYMIPLILLKGKIDKPTLFRLSDAYLKDNMDNDFYQGTNRTWVSNIAIYKGCIEDNYALILKGFKSIASTIVIADIQGHEGIKIDNSFHMHRPQLYSAGYGRGFSEHQSRYALLPVGTSFEKVFTSEKREILNGLLLGGHRMFSYREAVDFGAVGRNISRPNGIVHFSTSVLDRMALSQPNKAQDYLKWKEHVVAGTPYPAPGNKYFWKSDIMTHHGENYYLSAKVISTRTNGTESINGENIYGYYLPLGATNIMTHGNEYKDIFPIWNWTRIPGTTASANKKMTELPFYLFGANKFAGGVSDSINGVIAFENIYTGITAQKAYFFMGDALLCLGSGISSFQSTSDIITTINQCFANGDVTIGRNNSSETLKGGTSRLSDVNWIYHDNVGYVLLKNDSLYVERKELTGSWKSINRDGKDDKIKAKIFSAWFSHGDEPVNDSYAYVVMPNRPLKDFTAGKIDHGFEVIQNIPGVQAVKNSRLSSYAVIFYEPGVVDLGDGITIQSDKKVILYIQKLKDNYKVLASDPMHKEQSVNITLNNLTRQLNFPQGDYQGNSVTGIFESSVSDLQDFPKGSTPEEVGTRLVEKFLRTPHTRYGYPHHETPPTQIYYPEVCTWLGSLWFANKDNNKALLQQLEARFTPLLDTLKNMQPLPNHVDNNVFGAVPLELYKHSPKQEYLNLGLRYADSQWTLPKDAKPEEKTWADDGYSWQTRIWIDDMFMITSVQAQAYLVTKNKKYIDRAAREMAMYLDAIQLPNGLFYHSPQAPYCWARGNGWMAVGMAEVLKIVPQDNPDRAKIMTGYKKMMQSLLNYQAEDGMWRQLVDDTALWKETSGTAMFTYAMINGVKNGWLDKKTYGAAARKAWLSLVTYIDKNDDVTEVCEGTGIRDDREHYVNRKRITGDLHGQAPVIWCAYALLNN